MTEKESQNDRADQLRQLIREKTKQAPHETVEQLPGESNHDYVQRRMRELRQDGDKQRNEKRPPESDRDRQ